MRYNGFFYKDDKIVDNRKFYDYIINHPNDGAQIGVTVEDARNHLEFFNRFPPGTYDRLVGHVARVYQVKDPIWKKKGKHLQAEGSLEKIFEIDLGEEIRKYCQEEKHINEYLGEEEIDMGDGTVIVGKRIKKSRFRISPKNKNHRIVEREYFKIEFNPTSYESTGDFSYELDIDKNKISCSNPVEFQIKSYVKFNGVLDKEKLEVARVLYKKRKGCDHPGEAHQIVYTQS